MILGRPIFLFMFAFFKIYYCNEYNEDEDSVNIYRGQSFSFDKFYEEMRLPSTSNFVTRLLLNQINSESMPTLIPDNMSVDLVEDIIYKYALGIKQEDVRLDIVQLITKYGYPVEQHQVHTDDGYILSVFRIPGKGSVVFLMHGLLGSSDDWVTAGPESGLAYLLASEGYDVWIGNARGNKHSRKHKKLLPSKAEFWDFSWDEIGRYDLPAMIDFILDKTGQSKLKYVGHSQGTTSFFVMGSSRPDYNDKISLMVALSAVAWMSHAKSPLARLLAPVHPFLSKVLHAVGYHEFVPSTTVTRFFQAALCGLQWSAQIFCNNLAFLLCGFNSDQVNVTNLPVLYGHIPSGAATKQIVHYGQGIVSGHFREFNYGSELNIKRYETESPPDYPVEKITAPIAIFTGDQDWFANITDVDTLVEKLPNLVEVYNVPDKKFNHLDFVFAKDVKVLVFHKLLQLLKKY